MLKRCFCMIMAIFFALSVTYSGVLGSEVDGGEIVRIFVNGVRVELEGVSLINYDEAFIPLRAVLEALGSNVVWEEETGNVYFNFAETNYVCQFVSLNPDFPDFKSILVCESKNIDSKDNSDFLQLNLMSADGTYELINGTTLLYYDTGKRLFEALGCEVTTDMKQKIVEICYNDTHLIEGYLYVNGSLVENKDPIIFKESVKLPFIAIMESIGAMVKYDIETENGVVLYNEDEYIYYIHNPNPEYSCEYFYVKNKRANNIYLNPMGFGGSFEIINEKIYLHQQTMERILESFDWNLEVDFEKKFVYISKN